MFDENMHSDQGLPIGAGVGYKPQHFQAIIDDPGAVTWLEIHAENYMGEGGRALAQLRHLAERFPISCHGVGLSIGGEGRLDPDHLTRLRQLVNWLNPVVFSEHLAWSTHDGAYLNDLIALPYTNATLTRVTDHIDELQQTIGRQMMLENPSSYLAFAESTWSEPDFLCEVAGRTGCGLLLDVNNVFISATNMSFDPRGYIDGYPIDLVGEIHLGGHNPDTDDQGRPLLIDDHGHPVAQAVWALYDYTIAAMGPRPTLIEWDNDIPDWAVLEAEASRAVQSLEGATA